MLDTRTAEVLVVAEKPEIAQILRHDYERFGRYRVETAVLEKAGIGLVSGKCALPDVIILETGQIREEHIHFVKEMRQHKPTRHIPVLLVATETDERIWELMEAGATDFVFSPVNPNHLSIRLANHVRYRETLCLLEQQNFLLRNLVAYDELTGLYNRRAFMKALSAEAESSNRASQNLVLYLFDVDNFKAINDKYGHLAGDHVLQTISKIIPACVRTMDTFARYGGDEFCLLQTNMTYEQIIVIAQRLRTCVEEIDFSTCFPDIANLRVTISIGITIINPGTPSLPQDVIAAADRALYKSKEQGRNRYSILQYESKPELCQPLCYRDQ